MSVKNRFKVNPTRLQENVFDFLNQGHPYSLIVGEAGTGKDFCSIYHALTMLYNKDIAKIILVKPLVEVGSSIGYLPGAEKDKFAPYAESMLEIVRLLIGPAETSKLENAKVISFEPIQFMRGSTYDHSCVILSEAQNANLHQLITFLTRKGKTSKFILNGDFLQADIKDSGFKKMLNILPIPELGLMELGEEYQMRDAVVSKISRLYRKYLENTYNDKQSFNFHN